MTSNYTLSWPVRPHSTLSLPLKPQILWHQKLPHTVWYYNSSFSKFLLFKSLKGWILRMIFFYETSLKSAVINLHTMWICCVHILRFSQRCGSWNLRLSKMKKYLASQCQEMITQWHSIVTQKNRILKGNSTLIQSTPQALLTTNSAWYGPQVSQSISPSSVTLIHSSGLTSTYLQSFHNVAVC